MSYEDAVRDKWVTAFASALLSIRSGGPKRRTLTTSHGVPIVGLTFLTGKGGAVSLDTAGYVSTHKYVTNVCVVVIMAIVFMMYVFVYLRQIAGTLWTQIVTL